MSFFAVLFALLVEQFKPLPRMARAQEALAGWFHWTSRNFNAGRDHHAWVVWSISIVAPTLVACAIHALIAPWSLILALLFDVVLLYLTLGFRQFSHYFTDIRDALERGDEFEARRLLAQWRGQEARLLPRSELLRHVIEQSLLAAHRHVFGVFFWFVLLSSFGLGPAGAVLYRLAEFGARFWAMDSSTAESAPQDRLADIAQKVFHALDYVPSRLTAFGFAVVGNFEEAVTCWRRDALLWKDSNEGVLLSRPQAPSASGSGVRVVPTCLRPSWWRRSMAPWTRTRC